MVKLFGTTINETLLAFNPVHLGGNQSTTTNQDKTKAIGRIIVTLVLLGVAVYLMANDINKQLGVTIISATIGYWIK